MSQEYCIKTGLNSDPTTTQEMRLLCQRPGRKDADGNTVYFTEQSHKKECDINEIIRKYDRQGVILHVNRIEAKYGDMSGFDFRSAHDLVFNARNMFMDLPSDIRKRFQNDPGSFIEFMEDPDNRNEAIELGLISGDTPPESDGLGEHVVDGVVQTEDNPTE